MQHICLHRVVRVGAEVKVRVKDKDKVRVRVRVNGKVRVGMYGLG
jgi:hypothetical protein